jgi:hypothetical protein
VRIGAVANSGRDFRITENYAQMQTRCFLLIALCAVLAAQSPSKLETKIIHVSAGAPGAPPLHDPTCTGSSVGYLESEADGHTDVTAKEIGKYVLDHINSGTVLTIFPPTKDGIFVVVDCGRPNVYR